MEFCLHYEGRIRSNDRAKGKHHIRRSLHNQVQSVCSGEPFSHLFELEKKHGNSNLHTIIDGKRFNFLVDASMCFGVDLTISFFFPQKVEAGIVHRGDVDNRLKTLLDGLRIPQVPNEIPREDDFEYGDVGMFCLLEDDKVINKISVEVFQDHEPIDERSCRAIIKVRTMMLSLKTPTIAFM